MYRVTAENTENGTTQVYDDLRSMMPVMLSEHGDNVVFENDFINDVEHEARTFGLLSLAQGYVFAGLAEYRKNDKGRNAQRHPRAKIARFHAGSDRKTCTGDQKRGV